jgi:hypothetical protein
VFCLLALSLGAIPARAEMDVRPVLVVTQNGVTSRTPFVWKDRVATVRTPDGALEVALKRERVVGEAGETLAMDAVWRKKAWVRGLAVELALPGAEARVIGRDLEPATVKLAYLGRFDPKWISVGGTTVIVDDTVDGVVVRAAGKHVELRVELDAVDARPFTHDARCTKNWHEPNKHLPLPVRLRVPDERLTARVQLVEGATLPLAKTGFPDGRRAAVAITDHADQSTLRTLGALAEGLLKYHLSITKALFAHGADRPQLEDPKVMKLADALSAAGSEIVPHSATPKRDERSVTSAALDLFERWKTRTWIDHQPETNCEAFGDQGFRTGGRFGIADLLAARQYQYVWAQADAPPNELNLSMPKRLDRRAPTVWPIGRLDLGGPDSLWMFRSVWVYLEAKRFYALYTPERLDQLERERGLHIAHTYLETYHPKRTKFGLKNLLVPADAKKGLPGGPGDVKLDPRFDALLQRLGARQDRGTLWVAPLGTLADRLRAAAEVTYTLRDDGSVLLRAPKPLPGATFVVRRAGVKVTLGGKPPRGLRADRDATTFWDDLPAGDTVLALAAADGTALPFAGPVTAPRAER